MMVWLAALVSVPFLWIVVRRVTLRRLAGRHIARRPIEALLVVLGSLLGTAIITGSLVVGDTIDRSIRAGAYDQLGPIDETVSVQGLDAGEALVARFEGFSSPDVDGVLSFVTAGAAVVATGTGGGTQPRAQLLEVDFAAGRAFGPDPSITGLEGETPGPGQAVVTVDLARKLSLAPGDEITIFAFGAQTQLAVERVVARRGVAGYWTIDGRQQSYNVLVAPGTIASLAGGSVGSAEPSGGPDDPALVPPEVIVAISNVGGVESGASRTEAATLAADAVAADLGLRAVPAKETLLDLADENGKGLSQLYFTLGMFAVAAGVMLLVNIFVMLADERRSELGMLRAIGMRRAPLIGAFALEGWLYALVSSALGAVAGIGLGWFMSWRADAILSSGEEVNALSMEFSFENATVGRGFALGFVIALATIVITSVRISRFNVIRAIRDVQEPPRARPRRRFARGGLVVALLGIAYSVFGFGARDAFGVMLGPALAVAGIAPQLARRWNGRVVATATATIVLAWAVVAIPVLGALDVAIEIPIFLAQGLTMAAAAITLVVLHQANIGGVVGRLTNRSLPVRLGFAYPLARRFRTAMTLGMFAVVMLTLVYMSVLSFMFRQQGDSLASDLSGGFGIIASSSSSNPMTAAELAGVAGVDAVAPLSQVVADFTIGRDHPMAWAVTGFDAQLLRSPPKLDDLGRHPTNDAAWTAVLDDPGLIIVDQFFLSTAGGPHSDPADIGDVVIITDPQSGLDRELTVAAIAEDDLVGNGAFVSSALLTELFGARAAPSRFFVSSSDPDTTVEAIRSTFIANGADASTVASLVDSLLAQQSSFFTLMQQFVGAGLIVGVAGIGVILVRAVRERRRQVGVLRSLGFPARGVAAMLVLEAGFVALEGVLIGVAIALVASSGFAASDADWAEGMTWGVPIGEVVLIVAIALAATLVASLWPARRATQIRPAAALRIAD
jgi:putative ABC transport system permease protein